MVALPEALEAAPLPPPPTRHLPVREIDPPEGWSPVVPLSVRGRPLLARDRRPDGDPSPFDRTAAAVVATLSLALGGLATLLLI